MVRQVARSPALRSKGGSFTQEPETESITRVYGAGIYRSTDQGEHWVSENTGLKNLFVWPYLHTDQYMYLGVAGGGVWRRPLSDFQSGVNDCSSVFNESISNFPNPFKNETTLNYSIATTSIVSLTVFNALGEKVATLINSKIEAGVHNVDFYAQSVPSALYFYRFIAGTAQKIGSLSIVRN